MRFSQFIPVLQVAIGPVILISGVGMLLLSMTNRFGRVTDRSRTLVEVMKTAEPAHREAVKRQIQILWRRARIIRVAISLAAGSALLAALLIIILFLSALLEWEVVPLIITVFSACMAAVIGSLGLFLRDVNLSLEALRLEVGMEE